jgi:hypothetical protein
VLFCRIVAAPWPPGFPDSALPRLDGQRLFVIVYVAAQAQKHARAGSAGPRVQIIDS